MNEQRLKEKVDDYLKSMVRSGHPVWFLKVHGGPYQRVGVPDYVLCLAGRFHGLELKNPEERNPSPSPAQSKEMAAITLARGNCLCSNDFEQVKAWLFDRLAQSLMGL